MSFHILYDCAFLLIYGCDLMLFKRTFGKGEEMNQDYTKTQKLTISAICIALYLVVMLCTQSFARALRLDNIRFVLLQRCTVYRIFFLFWLFPLGLPMLSAIL